MKNIEAFEAAAKALVPLIKGYRASSEDESLRQWYRDMIDRGCRHLEFFCRPHVSVAARREAKKWGIKKDLSEYKWKEIRNMDFLWLFHLDHVKPVSFLVDQLIEMKRVTVKNTFNLIMEMEVAWILKTENKKLDDRKYKTNRPNPYEAYNECAIIIHGKEWSHLANARRKLLA